MTIMTEKESIDKRKATLQVLELIIPGYKVIFTPRSMILSKQE